MERAVNVVGRALVAQPRVRLTGDALGDSRRQAGFADPRFARDEHGLAFALPGEALAFQQKTAPAPRASKMGNPCHPNRLKAALGIRYAFDHPRRDWLGDALYLVPAEIAQTEQIAEQPTRGG